MTQRLGNDTFLMLMVVLLITGAFIAGMNVGRSRAPQRSSYPVTAAFISSSKADLLRVLQEVPPGMLAVVGYADANGDAQALSSDDLCRPARATE